jgi:hypothetical protein
MVIKQMPTPIINVDALAAVRFGLRIALTCQTPGDTTKTGQRGPDKPAEWQGDRPAQHRHAQEDKQRPRTDDQEGYGTRGCCWPPDHLGGPVLPAISFRRP